MVDPRSYFPGPDRTAVDRPIFLLGNQGDGLTLVSRMLRRSQQVVSLSGDYRYWSGADEMHRAMRSILPPGLRSGGRWFGGAPRHAILTAPRSWSYASDDLIDGYRMRASDADLPDRRRLFRAIAGCMRRHGRGQPVRFIDKSQTFTVRLGYIDALLEGHDPHFVLVTRNPYASIYRAAIGFAGDMERYKKQLSLGDRIQVCTQHWMNSMDAVLEDARSVLRFKVMAFEEFLAAPKQSLSELCQFLSIDYGDDMVPAKGQSVPFGTRFSRRWFPVRPEVNDRYLEAIPQDHLEQVVARIEERAREFGYEPPVRP